MGQHARHATARRTPARNRRPRRFACRDQRKHLQQARNLTACVAVTPTYRSSVMYPRQTGRMDMYFPRESPGACGRFRHRGSPLRPRKRMWSPPTYCVSRTHSRLASASATSAVPVIPVRPPRSSSASRPDGDPAGEACRQGLLIYRKNANENTPSSSIVLRIFRRTVCLQVRRGSSDIEVTELAVTTCRSSLLPLVMIATPVGKSPSQRGNVWRRPA